MFVADINVGPYPVDSRAEEKFAEMMASNIGRRAVLKLRNTNAFAEVENSPFIETLRKVLDDTAEDDIEKHVVLKVVWWEDRCI